MDLHAPGSAAVFSHQSRHKIMSQFAGPSNQNCVYLNSSLFFLSVHFTKYTWISKVNRCKQIVPVYFLKHTLLHIIVRDDVLVCFIWFFFWKLSVSFLQNTSEISSKVNLQGFRWTAALMCLLQSSPCTVEQRRSGNASTWILFPSKCCQIPFIALHGGVTETPSQKIPISKPVNFLKSLL